MTIMSSGSGGGGAGIMWKVTDVSQGVGQDATGRYTKGWSVTYQISTGHTGTVFLAGDNVNPDQVRAAIDKQAAALYGVVGLASSG
jgi:hypothetical protein